MDKDYAELVQRIADFRANIEAKRDGLKEVCEDDRKWTKTYNPIIKTYDAVLTDLTYVEHAIKR